MKYPIRYTSLVIPLNASETVYPVNTFLPHEAEEIQAVKVSSSVPVRVALNDDGGQNFLNMEFLADEMGNDSLSLLEVSQPIESSLPITGYVKIEGTPAIGQTIITFKYKAKP